MSNPEKLANSHMYEELFRSWSTGNMRMFPDEITHADLWKAMEHKRLLALEHHGPEAEALHCDHLRARGIV